MLKNGHWRVARIDTDAPLLAVVVDTEEEFDWSRPLARDNVAVTAVRAQESAHRIFERHAIRPTYVIDYPVVSNEEGWRPLAELHADRLCEIGSHMQPWVNPPFAESINRRNSYPSNLPPELERAKIVTLTDAVADRFGERPITYKAGRYGIGPATAEILAELGYRIDASVVPESDFSADDGPDFRNWEDKPYWFGPGDAILELPVTQGFVGGLAPLGAPLYQTVTSGGMKRLHMPGLLARTHLLERIRLSPEGMSFDEMRRLTATLHARGHRVFSFTYHSPSLAPGHTPYTPDKAALDRFLDCFRAYFDWFMGPFGGKPATASEILALAR